ncbi:MAG TPA: PLP-dependent aminotransferase family protein [Mobilitalea sp.]|nr:PLP-dependent aminotransferase family protein [Acetivibrio sp.]HPU62959.1 PLP-dependent aminotransferase family protein [Mobilitalea sp.]
MLTYSFENRGSDSLYEYLYKQIRHDINTGKLVPNEKLPSKRALAKHLNISTVTVENAYSQLLAEGYIYSVPKSGYYVSDIIAEKNISDNEYRNGHGKYDAMATRKTAASNGNKGASDGFFIDFVNNYTAPENFPFTIWTKLMRETMSENKDKLMIKSPSTGIYELRCSIADYLYQFRGINAAPDQIVVGAGTEYLYGLIIQLLGHDKIYAVEDPGYRKISRIYGANRVKCVHIPLDEQGINIEDLEKSEADVVHISPSHHFPTGLVTPVSRRYELLSWACKSEDRYIIEDDYDSEFRLLGKPIPALQSIDVSEKVIYMNTFSKSLSSTIRISYMVLPKSLMERYNRELSFYACTVSNFEQYTLAKFIERGYLEKHINRMRNHYRKVRDDILINMKKHLKEKKGRIMEEDAGLHFLLKVDTKLSDEELVEKAAEKGINISCLSQYYHDRSCAKKNTLIINYSGIRTEDIEQGVKWLFEIF